MREIDKKDVDKPQVHTQSKHKHSRTLIGPRKLELLEKEKGNVMGPLEMKWSCATEHQEIKKGLIHNSCTLSGFLLSTEGPLICSTCPRGMWREGEGRDSARPGGLGAQ